MLFETSSRFVYLLKLSWLPLSNCLRSCFDRNQVDFPQFETVVFQRDSGHRAVAFTFDNNKAVIRSEPHLESFPSAVWRRTDFAETELPEKCKRGPHGLHELRQRRGLDIVCHDNSPRRPRSPRRKYIRSSPEAGYEARGNVLRVFPIAWQFRCEQAIFQRGPNNEQDCVQRGRDQRDPRP
jgi:hypothetical protein